MVGSEGGGDDVVSNVFVVGWLSEFVFRACDGQFAWRSWFLYRYLGGLSDDHQQVSALSMSAGGLCVRWCRKRDSQGTTQNRRVLCPSVSSGVHGVSI